MIALSPDRMDELRTDWWGFAWCGVCVGVIFVGVLHRLVHDPNPHFSADRVLCFDDTRCFWIDRMFGGVSVQAYGESDS